MKHLLLTFMAFLVCVSLAQAEGSFVGIDYGTTKYDPEATTTGDFDDKDRGYVVVVGNRFKNGVGFEFNYADLGDFSIDFDQNDTISIDDIVYRATADVTLKGETTSLGIAASYKLDISESLAIVPRLGIHQYDADFDVSSFIGDENTGVADASANGSDLFYGISAQVALSESVDGTIGATRYTFGDDTLDLMSIGVRLNFN